MSDMGSPTLIHQPPRKGQAIVAFVTLEGGHEANDDMAKALGEHVAHEIGAIARPSEIRFSDALPKTRSGKILRGMILRVYAGQPAGDLTSVENPVSLEAIVALRPA